MRSLLIFFLTVNIFASIRTPKRLVDRALVDRACLRYDAIDCALVHAVVHGESSYRAIKVLDTNNKHSYGPMMVQCATAKEVGLKFNCNQLVTNPMIGLRFGILYLNKKLQNTDTIKDALAAYNAGDVYRCRKTRYSSEGKLVCYQNEHVNYDYVQKIYRIYQLELHRGTL